ncbi:MAG: DUF998 domain-containing protein [Bacteroidota bacterium]
MKRLAVWSGVVGPILFAGMVIWLTVVEYDFLRTLGWDGIRRPTLDWPSGLALGPYGGWMIATFIASGLLIALFGLGLRQALPPGLSTTLGTTLLILAGIAMTGESFLADPLKDPGPATWHGMLHDTFFVVLGLTLMPGMLALGRAFRRDPRWRGLSVYTWTTAALALITFFFKGIAFYVFLAAILTWSEVIALRLASVQ